MYPVAFDIETIPNLNMIGYLPEPEPDSRIKDLEKVAADIEKKRKKQIDDMALSPLFGRICAFSTWGETIESRGYDVVKDVSDAEEIRLIQSALKIFAIGSSVSPSVITWNGFSFDIPFLVKRAILLGVEIPLGFPGLAYFCRKYSHIPHCDMAMELSSWGTKICSLEVAANVFLGERKLDHDFSKFIEMIESGNGEEIGLYCMKDSELTYRIYKKAEPYLW